MSMFGHEIELVNHDEQNALNIPHQSGQNLWILNIMCNFI